MDLNLHPTHNEDHGSSSSYFDYGVKDWSTRLGLCYEPRGVFHTRAQVSEVVILTQLVRKINLTFILLVPPSITVILVIKIGIFILIPTLTIVFTLFLIPSRLLVALLV